MNNIKKYREEMNLSQRELADCLKVTKPYISMLESGKRQPSWDMSKRIAKFLTGSDDARLIWESEK